jgi:hypothetical protein
MSISPESRLRVLAWIVGKPEISAVRLSFGELQIANALLDVRILMCGS